MEPEIIVFDETEATESSCSSSSANDSRKQPTEGSMTIKESASFADFHINKITEQSLNDPVEILRFLYKNLVKLTLFVLMGIISWNPHF